MSAHDTTGVGNVPGSDDDPSAVSAGYWFVLLGVFTITSIFSLTYLARASMTKAEQGAKAPSYAGALETLYAQQEKELEADINADRLTLASGEVVEGIVVDATNASGERRVTVWGVRARMQQRAGLADPFSGKPIADYSPDEVRKLTVGSGKKLAVPIEQALKLTLKDLGK